MKKRWLLIFFAISLAMSSIAQNYESAFQQMKTAFNSGDFATLSNLFSDSVDLTVKNTNGIFSKTQAKGVLKNFFENDNPKSFQIKHQGASNGGTMYVIGLYVSQNASYRVYALYKEIQGSAKIVQLQIDKE
jgi:hypothetical protein